MKDLPPGHYPASELSDSSDLAGSPVVPQRRNEPGVRPAKPRRPWLALFLGLCFQGLGHLYAGAPLRGAVALLLLMILLPSLTVVRAMLDFSRAGVLIGLALVFLAALVVPIDGALTARKRRYEPPARWNRVSIYALYAVAFTLMFPPALRWELDRSWFRNFKIVSGQMEATLLIGDYVTVDTRQSKLFPMRRGMIAVFRHPRHQEELLIKRVVGLPGETIELRDGILYIDRRPKQESYVSPQYRDHDDFGPMTIDAGHYFVLGDHRNRSNDSRSWGLVPEDHMRGRVRSIWWSSEEVVDVRDYSPIERLRSWVRRPIRFLVHTRWRRVGLRLE